jgi:uncharacterized membrane protein
MMKVRRNAKSEAHTRSFLKAISWRVLATLTTMIISFFVTGNLVYAVSIGSIEVVVKIILFYFHERLWALTLFGKRHAVE